MSRLQKLIGSFCFEALNNMVFALRIEVETLF